MLKSKWIASVLALTLTIIPVQGVTAAETGTDSEVMTTQVSTTSGGDAVTAEGEERKLGTPTGLSWTTGSDGYLTAHWNAVDGAQAGKTEYCVDIYHEGSFGPIMSIQTYDTSLSITQEHLLGGDHQFRVRVNGGSYSELSPVFTVKKVPTVTGVKWNLDVPGYAIATWNAITDMPVVYELELYRTDADIYMAVSGITENKYYFDIDDLAEGEYWIHIRAREIGGQGRVGYFPMYGGKDELCEVKKDGTSEDLVITPAACVSFDKVVDIKNSLQSIVRDNTNAVDAVESIKKNQDKVKLGAAMQQNSSVAELMSSLEKDYLKVNNITVSQNIEAGVNDFMDPNAISVIGAGLNVESGNVALDVSVPGAKIDLGRKYSNYNNLQFEIKLVGDNLAEHGQLAVPVVITMPIPNGLTLKNLEIIHCKSDGTYERISPRNNGDGTISFAVTEFSTFAFVSPAETADDTKNDDIKNDDSDSSDSGSAEVVYNVDWNNVLNTVAANKTGTTDITTGNSMQVSEQLLQTLKNTKGVLALHTGKGITVSICGKDLKKTDKNVVITFAEEPNIPASAKNAILENTLYSRSFEMKEKVLYSVKMDIHFNVGKQFAGKYANLYHYDELTGTMKLEGSYRITDTGAAMFPLYHGDEYILTVTEKAPKGVVPGGVSNADYTVAKGDTLWGIAARNGISLRKILAANPNLKNPDKIRVGQKIVIK